MEYKIKVWIPVEVDEDEDELYKTREEAEADLENMEFMQPENIYQIEEVEE
jgi:hypothetical protein